MIRENQTTRLLSLQKPTKKLALKIKVEENRPNTLSQVQLDLAALENYLQYSIATRSIQEKIYLNHEIETGVQKLVDLAGEINNLSSDIEALMLNFKEIAVDINHKYHLMQQFQNLLTNQDNTAKLHRQRPLNIWEIHSSILPSVVRQGSKFIITSRIVNLFKSEPNPSNK
jgi:DNA repair exonuclease SbcCD ATPase subunit